MQIRKYIDFLGTVEKLKCNTRHSWTSDGRQESVAEHSWRVALMAMLCRDEYPELDMDKVIRMCLIHDFGEAILGDIPAFYKTNQDELQEEDAVKKLVATLPPPYDKELSELFDEMNALETREAKLYKALDNMETLISHNEAPLSTWLPLEYEANLIYGDSKVAFSPWTKELKAEIKKDSLDKIEREKQQTD